METTEVLSFQDARVQLRRIVDDWGTEIKETEKRRKQRKVEVDVKQLQKDNKLDEDETLIPVRIIDQNITKEQPTFVSYIVNSRRLVTFDCRSDSNQDVQGLELEYAKGMRYNAWQIPYIKTLDGAEAHGWDAAEVEYDESKPFKLGITHIGHDKLFFPKSCVNIQDAPRVIRQFDVTVAKLREWVSKYGFNNEQVELLCEKKVGKEAEFETFPIYREYYKEAGVVMVAWFALSDGVNDWLKAPAKLFLGIGQNFNGEVIPDDITQYPIFLLYYRVTEESVITEGKGRCFLDQYKQESQTAILSAFVNGLTRASQIYGAVEEESGDGSSVKALEQKLVPGRIFSKPVKFWSTPYPDAIILQYLKDADTRNAQETNQVNFAAMNREDSRKTAREISAAQETQSLLNSVQLVLFSIWFQEIHTFCWTIVQKLALGGKIALLQIPQQQPVVNPLTNQPSIDPTTGQPATQTVLVNDIQTLQKQYVVTAAGDVDVIQRERKVMQMMQDWPVISQTSLANVFLKDMMKLKYPDTGEQYAKILDQMPQVQQLQIQNKQLSVIMQGMLKQHPEMMNEVPPQEAAMMQQMIGGEQQNAT